MACLYGHDPVSRLHTEEVPSRREVEPSLQSAQFFSTFGNDVCVGYIQRNHVLQNPRLVPAEKKSHSISSLMPSVVLHDSYLK